LLKPIPLFKETLQTISNFEHNNNARAED